MISFSFSPNPTLIRQLQAVTPTLAGHTGKMHLAGADHIGFAISQERLVADAESVVGNDRRSCGLPEHGGTESRAQKR